MSERPCRWPGCERNALPAPMRQLCRRHRDVVPMVVGWPRAIHTMAALAKFDRMSAAEISARLRVGEGSVPVSSR